MATTVGDLLTVIKDFVLEADTSFPSGMWNVAEILNFVNKVQRDFILKSQALKGVGCVASTAGTRTYSDPAESMQLDRIAFATRPMNRTMRMVLDLENPAWRTVAGRPGQYHQDQLATKTFSVDKAPTSAMVGTGYTNSGTVGLLRGMAGSYTYVGLLPAGGGGGTPRRFFSTTGLRAYNANGRYGILRRTITGASNFETIHTVLPDDVANESDTLSVPDHMVIYLRYGVLSMLWSAEGEGQDLARAKYCQDRYLRGINLFRKLIGADALKMDTGG